MLPKTESRWWYDTTYPQYVESSVILSDWNDTEDDRVRDLVEQKTYDELVEGTNSVSKDVWVTGDRLNQHNNSYRTVESVQFLRRKEDVPVRDIVKSEVEDMVFMKTLERESDYSAPEVCRRIEEPGQYEGDVYADISTLELNPVNMRGRETIRNSNWSGNPNLERTPTLTRTRPGHHSHSVSYRQEWERPSSSNTYVRIGSTPQEVKDVNNLESLFDQKYNGSIVDYNGTSVNKDNVLYIDQSADTVNIIYSEVGQLENFP